jgi:hypothetical protein
VVGFEPFARKKDFGLVIHGVLLFRANWRPFARRQGANWP